MRGLVWFARACFVVAAILLTILHVDPRWGGINPIASMLSEYALRPGWWMWDSALCLTSLGSVAVTIVLYRQGLLRGWVPVSCLVLWCVSVVMVAVFTKDPQGGAVTAAGKLHLSATAVSCVSLPLGGWVLGRRYRTHERWRVLARWVRRSAELSVPFFLPFIVPFAVHVLVGVQRLPALPTGLLERVMVALQLLLLAVLATWASRATPGAPTPVPAVV
ncbi:DUF998 domain-containing protein [Amycolatopsis sp. H20-H5]|uniref:DUF998 domain-containing protein n=1 Tax=Amycolatopsis sp. H20-H5 TaxID=3046309 RepID=UPI002DB5632D|nr:DUF998 domain-containing protein [Amycolatopsis sp. H20-H5]MEC3980948.1 DUF998 domain-containing protein [Amycolatopsis sp. H20-H5]